MRYIHLGVLLHRKPGEHLVPSSSIVPTIFHSLDMRTDRLIVSSLHHIARSTQTNICIHLIATCSSSRVD